MRREQDHSDGPEGDASRDDGTTDRATDRATDRQLALYQLVFDQAGVGMAICELDGRLGRVNRALCDLLGYDERELCGRHYREVTHPEDLEIDRDLAERLVAGRVSHYQVEKRYVRRDGQI